MEKKYLDFSRVDGFEYTKEEENGTTLTYFEFHIDYHDSLLNEWEILGISEPKFGANLSVRKKENEKPIIMISQDECIFKQFLFSHRHWCLPDGTTPPMPKEEGQGVMLSSFVSREFGYGMQLSSAQLSHVNEYRKGQHYLDKEAAMEINKTTLKQALTSSPFTSYFQYGANYEGYWNYNTMVLQFEDVIDVLTCLYGNQYQYVFYFDHSSGHDCSRPDGLNSNEMNKLFGGKQSKMRKSKIGNDSYLGNFDHPDKLKVGKYQSMSFQAGDSGPFYLSAEERERRKNNIEINKNVTNKYSRSFLIDQIKEKTGVQQVRGNLKEVQETATKLNIPIQFTTKKVLEGWLGKPKGMMQILWERGFFDPSKNTNDLMRYYSKDLKKDCITKEPIPSSSLKEIISNLPDFKSEITLLHRLFPQVPS